MKPILLSLTIAMSLLLFAFQAPASYLGTNITIYDGYGYMGSGPGGEDEETEPDNVLNQSWDLEGIFIDCTIFSLVGGYHFRDGQDGIMSGDIFVDVDGDAGSVPNQTVPVSGDIQDTFGYDYVFDLDFSPMTYDIYSLDENSWTTTVSFQQNAAHNPWKYSSGGSLISTGWTPQPFTFQPLNAAENPGFIGDTRYALTGFDIQPILDVLGAGAWDITFHFTQECGNDNLMGVAPIPEPTTLLLFGSGLILCAALARKRLLRHTGAKEK